jgi:hypothetical protein
MQTDKGQPEFGPNPSRACSTKPLVAHLSGPWYQRDSPRISLPPAELGSRRGIRRLAYETAQLTQRDSGLISFLTNAAEICRARGIAEDRAGLPAGLWRLLELAEAVRKNNGPNPIVHSFLITSQLRQTLDPREHVARTFTEQNSRIKC